MSENSRGADNPLSPERRLLLGGLAAAVGAAAMGEAGATTAPVASAARPDADASLRDAIDTVVIIYAENRSFNNLFGDFPGVEQPLSAVRPERYIQRDRDGTVLKQLPPIWDGLVPHRQVVEHREYLGDETVYAPLANAPFALTTPEGDPLPHGLVTRDLVHAFYNNQLQINGGRNDGFVAWGNSGALVMGY